MFFRTKYLFGYCLFFHSIFELRFKDLIWRKILSLNIMNVYVKFSRSVFGIAYHFRLGKKILQHNLKETLFLDTFALFTYKTSFCLCEY